MQYPWEVFGAGTATTTHGWHQIQVCFMHYNRQALGFIDHSALATCLPMVKATIITTTPFAERDPIISIHSPYLHPELMTSELCST